MIVTAVCLFQANCSLFLSLVSMGMVISSVNHFRVTVRDGVSQE